MAIYSVESGDQRHQIEAETMEEAAQIFVRDLVPEGGSLGLLILISEGEEGEPHFISTEHVCEAAGVSFPEGLTPE